MVSCPHLLLQQDHIVDRILDFLPQPTLVTCLRTAEPLQYASARRLYHTVTLDSNKRIAKFFHGVHVGFGAKSKVECNLLSSPHKGAQCQRLKKMPKVELVRPSLRAPPPLKSYEFLYNEAYNRPNGIDPVGPLPAHYKGHNNTKRASSSRRNTKAPFLALVKVLTIGGHHLCTCAHYGPLVVPLLSNIQVLRITANFDSLFALNPVCDGAVSCPLMTAIKTPKIVFRNLDGQGLPLPQFNAYHERWKPKLYAPLKKCHGGGPLLPYPRAALRRPNLVHVAKFFPNAEHIKVVFWETWQGWTAADDTFVKFHAQLALVPDDVVFPIQQILAHTSAQVTLWGLSHVQFAPLGDVSDFYHSGNMAPEMYRMVWAEIQSGIAFDVLAGRRAVEDNGWLNRVVSFCLNHYLEYKDMRFGELEGVVCNCGHAHPEI
ncbi:uncharacterized protein LOC62_01G001551 [Vanrija pseudolonga]|uniref:Uncharacterized protein n=1 Tax=Vanrija pseudolonga TaxID=143232 RepID=A0AAF1BJ66_9TREE|nr:hypothetical protein LOC62_01G001551 [Vanrija pseudolonga]